jgi:Mrp family chromosome partitioning ATPase
MSKLYEALQNASRERERLETAKTPVVRPFESPSWKSDLEIMGLYQAIDAALGRKTSRVVQFIGTQGGEGCSTIVRELAAAAAARLEEAVLLIDLDFRSPSIDAAADPTFRYHLETLGAEAAPVDTPFCETEHENFTVSTFSPKCDPILALFDMARNDGPWERLKERFSLILIDAPPASVSPMGFSLLDRSDGVVLVIRGEKTQWPAALGLKERILREGGKIIGAVYNDRRYYTPAWLRKYL